MVLAWLSSIHMFLSYHYPWLSRLSSGFLPYPILSYHIHPYPIAIKVIVLSCHHPRWDWTTCETCQSLGRARQRNPAPSRWLKHVESLWNMRCLPSKKEQDVATIHWISMFTVLGWLKWWSGRESAPNGQKSWLVFLVILRRIGFSFHSPNIEYIPTRKSTGPWNE